MSLTLQPDAIVASLARRRVLVVGDVFVDEYIFGRATRLSREAPIPVLEFLRREYIGGGAANPANNIAALGATATLASVVGDDAEGVRLRELLGAAGVNVAGVLTDLGRPTTVKTRIVSEGTLRFSQQLARIDRIERRSVPRPVAEILLQYVAGQLAAVDAVLCSDYLSGLLTPDLVAELRSLCDEHGVLLTVDAQGELGKYRGAGMLRCNNDEAAAFLGRPIEGEDAFRTAMDELLERLEPHIMVVTRGRDGLSLQGREQPYLFVPAHRVEAADTTGAGDSFIAVMTLALAAGMDAAFAARLANYAAGLVVRRLGNATVTPAELVEGLQTGHI